MSDIERLETARRVDPRENSVTGLAFVEVAPSFVGDITQQWNSWVGAWHSWVNELSGRQGNVNFRGATWKKVPICDDRGGPTKEQVCPSLPLANRAATTLLKIAEGSAKQPGAARWKRALSEFLYSHHASMKALLDEIRVRQFASVIKDANRMYLHLTDNSLPQPVAWVNKVSALQKQTARVVQGAGKEFWKIWISKLFENNAKLGHRWANASNVTPTWADLPSSKSGECSILSNLTDQAEHFSELWKEEQGQEAARAAFKLLREWAFSQRNAGNESVSELVSAVSPAAIRRAIRGFKKPHLQDLVVWNCHF